MAVNETHDPPEVQVEQWSGVAGTVGWDIGANTGQSVVQMKTRFGTVYAFEPCRQSFVQLLRKYEDDQWVKTYQLAVSDHDGNVNLAVRAGPIQTGQLVSVGMPYYGEDHGKATAVWGEDNGFMGVACRSVDSLAREYGSPDFIKVDTEGHELHVLHGAEWLLQRADRPSWLVEFHSMSLYDQCSDWLRQYGYAVQTIRSPLYDPFVQDSMYWNHGWIKAVQPR